MCHGGGGQAELGILLGRRLVHVKAETTVRAQHAISWRVRALPNMQF